MRYAIYLTPPPGDPLCLQAEAWLGRSAFPRGERMAPAAAAAPEAANVAAPARYGFHATLRAPFRLAGGADEATLIAAFDAFCDMTDVPAPRLGVSPLGEFFALTAEDHAPLMDLAEKTVRQFEEIRAPLTPQDRARRSPDRLDARGRELLDAYGYPYVMERFAFHMTLTGKVAAEDADSVRSLAVDHFSGVLGRAQRLDLAIFREREPGAPFDIIRRADPPARRTEAPEPSSPKFAARDHTE